MHLISRLRCWSNSKQSWTRGVFARFASSRANVLTLWQFPQSWSDYDLILSASMLEYLARTDLSQALSGLRDRLVANGALLSVVTRKNWITKILIEWWWHAARYTRQELRSVLLAEHIELRVGRATRSIDPA